MDNRDGSYGLRCRPAFALRVEEPMTEENKIEVTQGSAPARSGGQSRSPFTGLRGEIDRLFDEFEPRGWFGRRWPDLGALRARGELVPEIDLVERDGGFEVQAELPGMTPDSVEVKLSGDVLTIRGEKSETRDEEQKDYHVSERRYGLFQRAIRLPDGIDADRIEADFANGVLTIKVPKSEKARASERKIDIRAG